MQVPLVKKNAFHVECCGFEEAMSVNPWTFNSKGVSWGDQVPEVSVCAFCANRQEDGGEDRHQMPGYVMSFPEKVI